MPDIFFAQKPTSASALVGDDPATLQAFLRSNGLTEREMIQPGRAYSLENDDVFTLSTLRRLNSLPMPERMCLARSAETMGEEAHILKVFFETHLSPEKIQEINGLVGAGATAAFARLNGFQQALVKYQEALLNLTRAHKSGGTGVGARRIQAENMARSAYQTLQKAYQTELNRISPEALRGKNRGNALSNADRGILLASRSSSARPDARLFVADATDAGRMGSLSRILNNTGRLAIVADAGLRANKIHATYENGGDWLRESSVQMTGFGFAGAAGGLTGKYTILAGTALAAKAGLLVAGPVGWAVLGVIVTVGVFAGLGAGSIADKRGRNIAAGIWDRS
ncbi:hypothetical protein [Marinobacter salexigens]|uniref:Uncharacterized protein n=1 Tax=Marinobacter salexigens TaxID=1925763 RepID=A0ABS6A5T9_9GAMM|nr:hypothetical protein [Marinobacter salexigens]MBU2873555.1 hypothetical protein [Marinobacter salexigens]